MEHISDSIYNLLEDMRVARDNEIAMASEVLSWFQYVTDHNDKSAWREIDRKVNALAKAWDKMIAMLAATEAKAKAIEASVENFYGD